MFRAVVNRDYLLLLDLFGQIVHGGAAAALPWRPLRALDPQRNLRPCGVQVSLILRCETCKQCTASTASVLVKLCQGIPRSGDKNLMFYFKLVSY